jgi:hypothetical protein
LVKIAVVSLVEAATVANNSVQEPAMRATTPSNHADSAGIAQLVEQLICNQ